MENDILIKKIDEQNAKIDALLLSSERTRKYLLISMWVTIVMLVLPLIIGVFVVPHLISTYLGALELAI